MSSIDERSLGSCSPEDLHGTARAIRWLAHGGNTVEIEVSFSHGEYRFISDEAARRGIEVGDLVASWIRPRLTRARIVRLLKLTFSVFRRRIRHPFRLQN